MTAAASNPTLNYLSAEAPKDPTRRVVIDSLTGVRAIAAFWVVFGHFQSLWFEMFPWSKSLDPVLSSGYLGVDLFFLLSGFILTHTYLTEFATQKFTIKRYGKFLWMRLARIYPVHLFCLIGLLIGSIVGAKVGIRFNAPERMAWSDFGHHLILTHAWGFGKVDSWNGPAWSISAEWAAYLVFPFLCLFVIKVKSPRWAWVAIGVCFALLWSFFGEIWPTYAPPYETDRPLVRILAEFAAGCFLYRIYDSGWGAHLRWSWVSAGSVAAMFAYMFVHPPSSDLSLLPVPILAILLLALAHSTTGLSAVLAAPFFVFWGEVSYALYMTHGLIQKVLYKILPPEKFDISPVVTKLGVVAVYVVLVGGVAIATYLFVEQPARRWMRRYVGKPKPVEESLPGTPEITAAVPSAGEVMTPVVTTT